MTSRSTTRKNTATCTTIVTEETGRQLRLMIDFEPAYLPTVSIGKEDTNENMDWPLSDKGSVFHKMETALGPEEDETEMDGGEGRLAE